MKKRLTLSIAACLWAGASAIANPTPTNSTSTVTASALQVLQENTTERLVIRYKSQSQGSSGVGAATATRSSASQAAAARTQSLVPDDAVGVRVSRIEMSGSNKAIVQLTGQTTLLEAQAIGVRLKELDPAIETVEPDLRVVPFQVSTNDSFFSLQWSLGYHPSNNRGGSGFTTAWTRQGNRTPVTVAVIDTGYLPHSDLSANEILGVNFVSSAVMAGNGVGRSNDPIDPGDYCEGTGDPSSWHGLKVASQIAAIANNSMGIAGAARGHAQILQIRALGRCGGYLSDVADAIKWAAGGTIAGFADTTSPARVINLSLGATGPACPLYMQDAIDFAVSRGAVVVAATGNEGGNFTAAPANCASVIAVAAHNRSGDMASYSNYSTLVSLTAPGGGSCRTFTGGCQQEGTLALGNTGTQGPGANTDGTYFMGTSAATPHVSAAAALLLAESPELAPAQVRNMLRSSARVHPAGTFCAANPTFCGTGMLDAAAAMSQVASPILTIPNPTRTVVGASEVEITVTADGTIGPFTFSWSRAAGPVVTLTPSQPNANTGVVRFTAPASKGAPVQLNVTVTGQNGKATTELVTVNVNNPPALQNPGTIVLERGVVSLMLPLSVSDPDLDAVSVVLVQGPQGARIDSNVLAWENARRGRHAFTVYATDGVFTSPQTTFWVEVQGSESSSSGGGAFTWTWVALMLAAVAYAAAIRRRGMKAGA